MLYKVLYYCRSIKDVYYSIDNFTFDLVKNVTNQRISLFD